MAGRVVAVLFGVAVALHGSDGKCKDGEATYEAGEEWPVMGECMGHSCLTNGSIAIVECPTEPKGTPAEKLPGEFPKCCPGYIPPNNSVSEIENLTDCTKDNTTVKVGYNFNIPGECSSYACLGNNKWAIGLTCDLRGAPYGWVDVPGDLSKPYPDCCGSKEPPLKIVPDVVDTLLPDFDLSVTYDENIHVSYGNELKPAQVRSPPSVSFRAEPEAWHLLTLADPDAPTPLFLHWLVGNIPSSNVTEGEVLSGYVGSGPSKDSGLHRYVFLLYKQPSKLTFDEPRVTERSVEHRGNFSVLAFAQKYNLSDPIAYNVFQAQWDESVPELHQQLGLKTN